MKITISMDFDSIKEEICNEFLNRMEDLNPEMTKDQLDALEKSFMENIDGGYVDAVFEVETNDDETEVTSCMLIGG